MASRQTYPAADRAQEGRAVTKQIKVPDAGHPISIDVGTVRVVARVGDTVIADTSAALTMREAGYPPVHYIPLDDVVPGMLRTSASDSYCPYKGDASYYDVVLPGGKELKDAVALSAHPYRLAVDDIEFVALGVSEGGPVAASVDLVEPGCA
jgi:uncharacterized protein (DUF427 family)